jgi:NADPH2:quinone reductase
MKAIRVARHGGPEVLELVELPDPTPGEGELVVRLAAAGLNFIDVYNRMGLYPTEAPFVPGQEGAGTVVEVGPGVEGWSPGDRVAWTSVLGSYAELVRVPARMAVRVPDGVDLETAAAVMLQGMTAHYLVTDTFPLGPGHRCLIHAAAGGVGLLLVQLAKRRGAEVVATAGGPEKVELAREAGADHVIDYRSEDFAEASRRLTGSDKPFDVVYDGVGKAVFMASLDLIRMRGMMVQFGNASGPVDPIAPLELGRRGSLFLTRPSLQHYIATREELERRASDLFSWIEAGELAVRIGHRLPLAEAATAHRMLEARETTGKVLLLP